MELVLIVCSDLNIQKFYVFNLVIRGHFAIGVSRLADQDEAFWQRYRPELVVMWGELTQLENDVKALRQNDEDDVPVILVSREKPAPNWIAAWGIAAHTAHLSDGRQLLDFLQPWLNSQSSRDSSITNRSHQ